MTEAWFLSRMRHPRDAVDPRREVALVVAQRALEGVRFDVGLVDDVQAELVGQVEEGRVVRVVRRAHGVEPELLHQHEVGAHRLDRDDAPGVLVEVVAVDAADEDARAVDEQVEARDLDPAEADLDRHLLGDVAVGVAQDDVQRVEVRLLGGPALDVGDVEVPGRRGRRAAAPSGDGRRSQARLVLGRRADPRRGGT